MSTAEALQTPATYPTYTLGERIRKARTDAGLQQDELAAMLGVSRPLVSKWERNKAIPDICEAVQIASITSKSLGWLADADPIIRWNMHAAGWTPLLAGQLEMDFEPRPELELVLS